VEAIPYLATPMDLIGEQVDIFFKTNYK